MTDNVVELGTFVETRDGVPLKFKVTTVPEEIIEELVEHMVTFFLPREPLCEHTKLLKDELALEASRVVWRELMKEGAAMVAIAEKPGPLKDRIVGANMTYISYKGKEEKIPENAGIFKDVFLACKVAVERANIFERYGVDKILSAFGLSVDTKYHGYHVGERLLQCRKPLCQHLGIKVTGTIFTASSSQYLSKKIGFKVLYEEEYPKYKRDDGTLFFEGLSGKLEYNALSYE
ncbi:uncharacterized protein [Halyomorpha halys]|uniref:uncharacterized protein n=1 Tax=Halyomorpha halys TaxID=286706 RepID=UPI0006D4E3A4|nr:uncharacterized protein LOC106681143 [Halyomorpha halys]XP_014276801.1 uncharacterized protein LOC106681143 [Halyomorpha halys]XP_024218786.1 uncharacterized protein LOC106681143 [Halyomorpha halys]